MRRRLQALVNKNLLRSEELEDFLILEEKMTLGFPGEDWLRSFHYSNDDYAKLLHKVLKGLCQIGEPYATEKLKAFLEELGIMAPAVFLTPWELTLTDLDREFGWPKK